MARSVCFVSCGVGVGIVAAFLNAALSGAAVAAGPTGTQLSELGLLGLVLWLTRRGAPDVAARLLAFSLPVFATTLMITSGQGFRDVAVLILPASLILCGLLLDRATLVAVTLLTVAPGGLRVLFTSGYGEEVIARHGVLEPGVLLLQKPYGLARLARRVREALQAQPER